MKKVLLNNFDLEQNDKIAIYGAGLLGFELFKHIQKKYPNVEIKFFIDKNLKKTPVDIYRIEEAREHFNEIDKVLIASIPPNSDEMVKELGNIEYVLAYKIESVLTERPCHRESLFIRENGDVYPCCKVWGVEKYKIGTIFDKDLLEKINEFDADCTCDNFKFIKGEKQERYDYLNIELSYICQAKCPMCCTNSPDIGNDYVFENYEKIEALISEFKPKNIFVQGGEILIQPKSLDFIQNIKENYGVNFDIITNGNNISQIDRAKGLFDSFTVSFVGFQKETYKCLMGLDVDKTKQFCAEILKTGKKLRVKYLLSPINIHELPLFLEWALGLENLDAIFIHDSNTLQYINLNTNDEYWSKIKQRTGKEVLKVLENRDLPNFDIDSTSMLLLDLNIPDLNK